MIQFFMSLSLPPMHGFHDFVVLALVSQLVVIVTPGAVDDHHAHPQSGARRCCCAGRRPERSVAGAAAGRGDPSAGVCCCKRIVMKIYPVNEQVAEQLHELLGGELPIGLLLLVVAVVPAICEELAFRGFILSGLRHLGHKWRAIVLSSIFFGVTHPIFQQSIVACIVGLVLGFIAVQTGSMLPGIVFHMVHNSLGVVLPKQLPLWLADHPALGWLVKFDRAGRLRFTPLSLVLSAVASGLLIPGSSGWPTPGPRKKACKKRSSSRPLDRCRCNRRLHAAMAPHFGPAELPLSLSAVLPKLSPIVVYRLRFRACPGCS